ncbi:MAG: hypothetical protein ABI946_02580 [Chthoniobacterales bacterium]
MKKYSIAAIALLACLTSASSPASGQSYVVTDLGALSKKNSSPAALNNQGQVTGTFFTTADDQSAFLYTYAKGALEDLGGSVSDSVNRAFGINESAQVVGDSTFGGAAFRADGPSPYSHAALFVGENAYDLGSLHPGEFSRATGINAKGQVVGFSGPDADGANSLAFVWSPGAGMSDIGTLGGAHARAVAINEAGNITGDSELASSALGEKHAFLYRMNSSGLVTDEAMIDLGTLGGSSSYGTAINAANHVVGYSSTADGNVRAFLYDGKAMRNLGSLGGKTPGIDMSCALGVNKTDRVVGYSYLPLDPITYGSPLGSLHAPQPVAFLSENGTMTDLNELIGSAAKTFRLYSATGINDQGQITANALEVESNTFHAVLLTPLPTDPPIRKANR